MPDRPRKKYADIDEDWDAFVEFVKDNGWEIDWDDPDQVHDAFQEYEEGCYEAANPYESRGLRESDFL